MADGPKTSGQTSQTLCCCSDYSVSAASATSYRRQFIGDAVMRRCGFYERNSQQQHSPVAWRGGAAGAAAATLCRRGDGRQRRHSISLYYGQRKL
eukprot:scaffold12961_cov56-Cyclotella_meneghiniana.AAC.3